MRRLSAQSSLVLVAAVATAAASIARAQMQSGTGSYFNTWPHQGR